MATLQGKWQFIENMSPALVDFNTLYSPVDIMFQSNDVNYVGFKYNTQNNFFSYMTSQTEQQDVFDDLLHKWALPEYKIVHFLEAQEVDDYFYNWFTSCATQLIVPAIDNIRLCQASDLKNVADAIRNKSKIEETLTFPDEFISVINQIEEPAKATFTLNSNRQFSDCVVRDKLEFPTEVDGTPVNQTFAVASNNTRFTVNVGELIIPDYFLVSNFQMFDFNTSANSKIKRLYCGSHTIQNWAAIYNLNYIEEYDFPYLTGDVYVGGLTNAPVSRRLHVKCPKATGAMFGRVGTSSHQVELILDAPKITVFGNSYSFDSPFTQYCTGDNTLPSVKTLRYSKIPNGEITFRFPAITEQTVANSFDAGGSGIMHLYLGPNMATCACSANWVSNSQYIDIHIPAGESTTKATLDAAGVAYTQDYVI